jgi:hypothetical protein
MTDKEIDTLLCLYDEDPAHLYGKMYRGWWEAIPSLKAKGLVIEWQDHPNGIWYQLTPEGRKVAERERALEALK